MSCPDFAKEVSYLVHAPICSPPMFLISKYHAQTTWSGQPPVARLQLVESIFFFLFYFFESMWAICMGELTAAAPLCFGIHQIEHVELEEFDHLAPEGKGSSVFQTCEALSAAEAELQREQVTDRLLLVQCRGDPDRLLPPAPERCYLSSTFVHTPCCSLHFPQKSGVVLRAFTCDESFCKQAAAVHWNAPYTSSGWNAGWEEGREGTILSFFPNKKWYRKRIQYTVHLTNFLTNSHCNVLSRIRRNKARGRIINADCLFASYNHIIIGRSLRTFTLGRKKLKTEATSAHPWQHD